MDSTKVSLELWVALWPRLFGEQKVCCESSARGRDSTQCTLGPVLWDLVAEVVKGDLNDEASVEAASKDAYGAFVVTNFWDNLSKEKEVCQGKLVADVTKCLGPKHVVCSGLENVKRLTGGKLEVEHFSGKGEVEEYFWSIGVPMTSVCVAAYFENFLTMGKATKAPDEDYFTLALPMRDIPMDGISLADIGAVVSSIFNSPAEFLGKAVGLSAEALTVQQYADVLSKTLGKEVQDAELTPEAYKKLGFPGAKEMANMFRSHHTKPDRDVQLTHQLNPKVKTSASLSQRTRETSWAFKLVKQPLTMQMSPL